MTALNIRFWRHQVTFTSSLCLFLVRETFSNQLLWRWKKLLVGNWISFFIFFSFFFHQFESEKRKLLSNTDLERRLRLIVIHFDPLHFHLYFYFYIFFVDNNFIWLIDWLFISYYYFCIFANSVTGTRAQK